MQVLLGLLLLFLAPGDASKNYDVEVTAAPARVGKPATALVRVTTKNGFHVNKDFPTSLQVTAPGDVKLAKAKLEKADAKTFAENEAAFEVKYTAATAGEKKLEATLRFAVCTDKDCFPVKEKLTLTAQVQ